MSVDALLAQLGKVRRTGPGRWLACCPVHQDRSPSLSIREMDDGRVLVHDFGGCSTEAILDSLGMTFEDLFPPRPIDHAPRERRPFNAHDVLETIAGEALLVAVAACNVRQGISLSDTDHTRLMVAAERLQIAASIANGEQ